MKINFRRMMSLSFIATIFLNVLIVGNEALGATVSLSTSPPGPYRWLDVANQAYIDSYRNSYSYSQATVEVVYYAIGNTLHGTLTAVNLKPNFAYQLKLAGNPDIDADSNERIGLAGRWWQELNGTGQNLNNKGDGSSPNPNDVIYFATRDDPDYRYTGYLVFDYFITDEYGNATFEFWTNSSYHVLWATNDSDGNDGRGHKDRSSYDGPLKQKTFDADESGDAYDDIGDDFSPRTVKIFGEWERLPVGGIFLQPGDYVAEIILTEESFHGSGGTYAGNWAAAMSARIDFIISDVNRPPVLDPIYDKTIDENQQLEFTVTASDPDGNSLIYSASNLPTGASFDPATQTFSWTPDYGDSGNYQITFKVIDDGSPAISDQEDVTISVVGLDVVTIITADYKAKPHLLLVEATSSVQPNAILTINVDGVNYGEMTFDSTNNTYMFRQKIYDAVENVTVISNLGGTNTVVLGETANTPPIANAGGDQQVTDSDGNGTETVTLNGSGSIDTDGAIQAYEWKEDGNVLGTSAVFEYAFSLGTHTVSLTITDDKGTTDSDTLLITVLPKDGPDSLTILRAEFTRKTKQLLVEATSTQQPDADLTLESYGTMTFAGSTYIFNSNVGNLRKGATVTVTSSFGGTATALVNIY